MRIAIFSDSHGDARAMIRIVESGKHGLVIHLGDCTGDVAELSRHTDVPVLYVAGNCDPFSDVPRELCTEICGIQVFLCHGNAYGGDPRAVASVAKERGCTLALYGHTHVPEDSVYDGVRVINPGSISRPRYPARAPSFAAGEIKNGKADINLVIYDY